MKTKTECLDTKDFKWIKVFENDLIIEDRYLTVNKEAIIECNQGDTGIWEQSDYIHRVTLQKKHIDAIILEKNMDGFYQITVGINMDFVLYVSKIDEAKTLHKNLIKWWENI